MENFVYVLNEWSLTKCGSLTWIPKKYVDEEKWIMVCFCTSGISVSTIFLWEISLDCEYFRCFILFYNENAIEQGTESDNKILNFSLLMVKQNGMLLKILVI